MEAFPWAFREAVILIWVKKKDDQWVPYAADGFMSKSRGLCLSQPLPGQDYTQFTQPQVWKTVQLPWPEINVSTNIWDSLVYLRSILS